MNKMKLVVAIINDDDAPIILDTMREAGFFATKISSSGGFLRLGNSTIICGVEESKIEELIQIIKEEGSSRTQVAPVVPNFFEALQAPVKVNVGGATIFVLDVDQFIKF